METLLVRILIWLIVAAVLLGVLRAIPDEWLDAWAKRIGQIVIVGLLLIALLVYIVVPMIHMTGSIG